MQVHRSNRMERLVDALARVVAVPLRDPFRAECIAVPSPGMERWLSMELAQRLGVWANPAFPFPRRLIDSALSGVLGVTTFDKALLAAAPDDPTDGYDPARLLFSIAARLPELSQRSEFAEVARYFASDVHEKRRLALSQRLADLFDQYATYRPDLVLRWQAGQEAHWQAQLFRELVGALGPHHIATRAKSLIDKLARSNASTSGLKGFPERLCLFGLSSLPPLYVDILSALAKRIDVHLFLLSPTPEYYGDQRSRREIDAELRRHGQDRDPNVEALLLSEGHPLLASLGRHGRELQEVLETHGGYQENADEALYEDPGTDSMLHVLQSDLFALRVRGRVATASADNALHERLPLPVDDLSISVHSCHGAMREVEVLHDQLAAALERPGLSAHDIIVMTPDIESYAPMIDAVFSETEGRPAIPFRIADRGALATHAVAFALDAIFDLLTSRLAASQVLDVLALEVVRERFGISAEELDMIRQWVSSSGIRWGVDAEHRAAVDQPGVDENTWRFGMARLALGYAMSSELSAHAADGGGREALFAGRAPLLVESSDADLLGRFFEACDTLFGLRAELIVPAKLDSWQLRVERLLSALIVRSPVTASEHHAVLRGVAALANDAQRAGFEAELDLAAFRTQLQRSLDARMPARGFLSGGVTFCQLLPMRSIPFKVVCLLGLNDGGYPSDDTPLGFDLIAKKPRVGDRSRRDDDRQLFLEALLSAREQLIITYTGQSVHDGKPLPPSVLVSELVDHLASTFALPDEQPNAATAMFERLVLRHPLQAFSPRYFGADDDPRLFSFATGHCIAASVAGARHQLRGARSPFVAGMLIKAEPTEEVELAELEAWLMRPLRMFCRKRLGLYLGDDLDSLADRESFALDHLERWQIATELTRRARRKLDLTSTEAAFRARGELPLGVPGQLEYRELSAQAHEIDQRFSQLATGAPLPPWRIDAALAGVRVIGELRDLWPSAQVRWQYSKLGGRRELQLWLRHLFLQYARTRADASHLPEDSVLVGRDHKDEVSAVRFGAVDDPEGALRALVELYVAARDAPVPLFEFASRKYAEVQPFEEGARALGSAGHAFARRQPLCDLDDPYVSTVYREWQEVVAQREPLSFEALALRIYQPLLAHRVMS